MNERLAVDDAGELIGCAVGVDNDKGVEAYG
jgi:hypothetical protein